MLNGTSGLVLLTALLSAASLANPEAPAAGCACNPCCCGSVCPCV